MHRVSSLPVRNLTLDELGFGQLVEEESTGSESNDLSRESELAIEDPILIKTQTALGMGYCGVILSGPPGSGKSWYAQQIAVSISGNWEAVRSVQFHPSYQYEDFVFGYVPNGDGGFELREKEFARLCRDAANQPEITFVMVIDELSRTDVVRVFGEALTYLEPDKREQPFHVAVGEELTVPRNLVLICTMNPWDKGIDELDVALERRFAQIDLKPDTAFLRKVLLEKGGSSEFVSRLIEFFESLQKTEPETVRLGQAYFLNCVDEESASRVWEFRLCSTLRRACSMDLSKFKDIESRWLKVVQASFNEPNAENPIGEQ